MLNLVQHLMKLMDYETLKQLQGDVLEVFGTASLSLFFLFLRLITSKGL